KGVQAKAGLLHTDGSLVLEGVEFVLPPPLKDGPSPWFIGCSGSSKAQHIANCRFVGEVTAYQACLGNSAATIHLRNCELLNAGNVALGFHTDLTVLCRLHNCVLAGGHVLGIQHQRTDPTATIHLSNNTLKSSGELIYVNHAAAGDPGKEPAVKRV